MHIGGGTLLGYDGVAVFENGFYIFPEGATLSSGAGGSLPAGTYGFKILYEWTDAKGQIHRSVVSAALSNAVSLNDKVTLVVPTLRVSNRDLSSVKIVVYMTEAGGSFYYRKSSTANTNATDTVTIEVATVVSNTADRGHPYR
jgi:hypothetical protein